MIKYNDGSFHPQLQCVEGEACNDPDIVLKTVQCSNDGPDANGLPMWTCSTDVEEPMEFGYTNPHCQSCSKESGSKGDIFPDRCVLQFSLYYPDDRAASRLTGTKENLISNIIGSMLAVCLALCCIYYCCCFPCFPCFWRRRDEHHHYYQTLSQQQQPMTTRGTHGRSIELPPPPRPSAPSSTNEGYLYYQQQSYGSSGSEGIAAAQPIPSAPPMSYGEVMEVEPLQPQRMQKS